MNKPIRVLQMIGGLNIGGSQMMIINLYEKIDRSKIQFDFIIDHPTHKELAERILLLGGKIYSMPTFNGKNIFKVYKAWDTFFKENNEYQILHSHVRSYASIFIPIAKKYGVTTIIHSHSTSNGRGITSIIKSMFQFPLRFQADYFFGCSIKAGEWLFGKSLVRSDRYYTLKNAIDVDATIFNEKIRKEYRKILGVTEERVFIHIGRLHPSKNHFFLINLFSKWLGKHPNDILLIVGDGELWDDINNLINELNLSNNIMMLGSREDVKNLLQASDCLLFPSLWEGVPITMIEAQVSGLPCLASDNITDDVFVSNLVTALPINKGLKPWISQMENMSFQRNDVSEIIKNSGYDIMTTTKWLFEFYLKIST